MSFMYPRTVAISRPVSVANVGAQAYGGLVASNETSIATGLSASIQLKKQQASKDYPDLPGDSGHTQWRIFVQGAALGLISVRDIVTDDLGQRYQVMAPYWNSLGYNLFCERLES